MELRGRVGTDEDEVDEERQLVLRHVTTSIARSIEVGKIGAFAFEQREGKSNEEGHCLIELISLPKTAQDEGSISCAWKVNCHWLNSVPTARHWCTKSLWKKTVDLARAVVTGAELRPMSPTGDMTKNKAFLGQEVEQRMQM